MGQLDSRAAREGSTVPKENPAKERGRGSRCPPVNAAGGRDRAERLPSDLHGSRSEPQTRSVSAEPRV